MTLRPWEAQKIFGTTVNEIRAPVAISVVPKSGSFRISWQRRLGGAPIEGFIVLVGNSPAELQDCATISKSEKMEYSHDVESLTNGSARFTTVVAFQGNSRSEVTEIWKVIPNVLGISQAPEKVDLSVIASIISAPAEAEAERKVEVATEEIASSVPANATNASVAQVLVQRTVNNVAAICSQCSGDVLLDCTLHMFVCSGCGTRYVQRVIDGKFLPTNILVNGICECCDPRRPLVCPQGESFRKCSLSNERYIELAGNGFVQISKLDYGVCTCCQPVSALLLNVQGQVICSRKRENLYVREGNQFVLRIPDAPPSLLNDIDRALANGSAGMMPNGILTSGDGQSSGRRRR